MTPALAHEKTKSKVYYIDKLSFSGGPKSLKAPPKTKKVMKSLIRLVKSEIRNVVVFKNFRGGIFVL